MSKNSNDDSSYSPPEKSSSTEKNNTSKKRKKTESKSSPGEIFENTSSGDNASVAKKTKEYVKQNQETTGIPKSDRCLDELARLFQKTSQGCSAVTLIKQTIVIADNSIFAKQRESKKDSDKIKLIKTIMQYFSELANKNEKLQKSREDVFKEICVGRLKGEEAGYIKLGDEILEKIAQDVLDTYKIKDQENWREKYTKKVQDYDPVQRPFVALSYELVGLIARDFLKIEKFIKDNLDKDENDLVVAFKGEKNSRIFTDQAGGIDEADEGQVQYEKNPGYIILDIDADGVHAEAKLIEYLIFTGILKNLAENEKVYIGISKLCCEGCDKFVKAINKVFGKQIEVIGVRGAHGLQPEWVQPIICQKDYINERVKEYEYLVTKEQTSQLSILAPGLNKENKDINVYQTHYSSSSPSDSYSSQNEKEDLVNLSSLSNLQISQEFFKRFAKFLGNDTRETILEKIQNEISSDDKQVENKKLLPLDLDTKWYDFLTIRDSLIEKEINVKHILGSAKNTKELNDILGKITEANTFYIISLNVNGLNGSFTETSHWVGLYITTNAEGKINQIKYINPIGQEINQELADTIYQKTKVEPLDLTVGKGPQFAYEAENKIELKGNINDCGPILVQLLFELHTEGKIITKFLNQQESIEFGQKCRREQKHPDEKKEDTNNNTPENSNLNDKDDMELSGNHVAEEEGWIE